MRILKTGSLAVIFLLSTLGTMRADSVTAAAFQTDSKIVQVDIDHSLSNPWVLVAVFDFAAGNLAGQQAENALAKGNSAQAQVYFQTAITDFNKALAAIGQHSLPASSPTVPDAGSLALLGCAGLVLFGALTRKYSN